MRKANTREVRESSSGPKLKSESHVIQRHESVHINHCHPIDFDTALKACSRAAAILSPSLTMPHTRLSDNAEQTKW